MPGPTLGEAVVAVGADTTGFQREFEQGIKGATQKAGASFTALGRSMTNAGKSLSLTVTAPILGIGIAAVKAQAQFEQSMNVLQVNASASSAEMARLDGLAKQLGKDTVFSAGEAAQAMLELAKGGFRVAQIEGGGIQATMALAATESINLADAATITSNAMNIFSLKAKDAGTIADTLAAGSAASTASVTSLAEGLGNVGAAATQAKLNLQDTVGVLAALDQEGLKGAEGGTALRSFLMRLVPTTKRARDAMDDLNISFTNSDGSMKGIGNIAGILQKRLGKLTDAQRKQALQTIFGTYASSAATILMKQGTKGVEKFITATKEQGIAQKLADARMSGTAGALEKLRGSLDTAALAAGEALAPAITTVAKVIGDLADKFSALNPSTQTAIVTAAALAAALGPVLIVTGSLFRAIGTIKLGLSGMSASMAATKASASTFGTSLLNAETRTVALKGALSKMGSVARGAAGPAGLGLMAVAATTSNKKLQGLAAIGGGALMGFAAGGPIGAAVGGTIGLLTTLASVTDDATNATAIQAKALDTWRAALDETNGALTRTVRAAALLSLQKSNPDLITDANQLGIQTRDLISALMGRADATERVRAATARARKEGGALGSAEFSLSNALFGVEGAFDKTGKTAGGLTEDFRRQRAEVLQNVHDLTTWKQVLGGMPREVFLKLRSSGFEPSVKMLQNLQKEFHLTPKQLNLIIKETGAKAVVTSAGHVKKAMEDVSNAHGNATPWANELIDTLNKTRAETNRKTRQIVDALVGPIKGARPDVGPFNTSLNNQLNGVKGTASTAGEGIGSALKGGILAGFSGVATLLANAAAGAVRTAKAAADAAAGNNSPSKLMAEAGRDLGLGLALGMNQSQRLVSASAASMMGAAITPVGIGNTHAVRPVAAPRQSLGNGGAPALMAGAMSTVTHEGVTVNQNYYGPSTSGDRLREIDWTLRYATARPNEAIA